MPRPAPPWLAVTFDANGQERLGVVDAKRGILDLQKASSALPGTMIAFMATLLGYMYTLERRVLNIDGEWLRALDAVLLPGVDAATGVRIHASDLDRAHVDEAIAFFARLPAADRTAVTVGCYRTTQICCDWSPDQIPTDRELEEWFARFEVEDVAPPDAEIA